IMHCRTAVASLRRQSGKPVTTRTRRRVVRPAPACYLASALPATGRAPTAFAGRESCMKHGRPDPERPGHAGDGRSFLAQPGTQIAGLRLRLAAVAIGPFSRGFVV